MSFTILNPGAGGGGEWQYYSLLTAEGSQDPNSMVDSGPTFAGNTNTIAIDRNATGGAILDLDDAATYWWDTGMTAEDDFGFRFKLLFTDEPTMDSSNIAVCVGLCSDVTNFGTYGYGAGANWQTSSVRGWRCKGNVRSVGGIGINNNGVIATCIRTGGTNSSSGNVANDYRMQGLDSNGDGVSNFYGVSSSAMNASAGSDSLKLFVAIQVIAAAASVETVEFKLAIQPFIKNTLA